MQARFQDLLGPSESLVLKSWPQDRLLATSFSQVLVLPFMASGYPSLAW